MIVEEKREELEAGAHLALGGVDYRIIKTVGKGSNSIVYQAAYKDNLQKEYEHYVLIKELFPYTETKDIYRERDGKIAVKGNARALFSMHEESFKRGNEIHLRHCEAYPQAAEGNLNSYTENGTLYTVYPFDGGVSLEDYMKGTQIGLLEIVWMMGELLDVLATFHDSEMLHLDISPDNILTVPLPVGLHKMKIRLFLIDYNCASHREAEGWKAAAYGFKEGYSAPEILMGRKEVFVPSTDLYSVCAVFFFLLTGRKLKKQEQRNKNLLAQTLTESEKICEESRTVKWKIQKILQKGLSQSPRVRYQDTEELKREFWELAERIEGKGITIQSLWEISQKRYLISKKRQKAENFSCTVSFWNEDNGVEEEQKLWERIRERKEHIYLFGEGGCGKTTYLHKIWRDHTQMYDSREPVVFYLSLMQCAVKAEKNPIQREILQQFEYGALEENKFQIEKRWEKLLNGETKIVLLLDGINETGDRRDMFLEEIQKLKEKKSVQLLVSDRWGCKGQREFKEFKQYEILNLTANEREKICKEKGLSAPKKDSALFGNRLFFSMYLEICGEKEQTGIISAQELMETYYKSIVEKAEMGKKDAGEKLGARYAMEWLLCMTADQMVERKLFVLSYEQMLKIVEQSYKRLNEKTFLLAFPSYMGKGSRISSRFLNVQAWYDFAVNQLLAEEWKLLVQGEEGWSFCHEELKNYFAEKGKSQRKRYGRETLRRRIKRTAVATLGAGVVFGMTGWMFGERFYPVFPKEKKIVLDSVKNLGVVLNDTYFIAKAEYDILDRAEDVQGKEERNRYVLWEKNARKLVEQCGFYSSLHEETVANEYLPLAQKVKLSIDREDVQELFVTPKDKFSSMETRVEILAQRLEKGKAGESLEVYRNYLDAYIEWLNLKAACVVNEYPKEYRQEFSKMLNGQVLYSAIWGTKEEIETELENAEKVLKERERQMMLEGM